MMMIGEAFGVHHGGQGPSSPVDPSGILFNDPTPLPTTPSQPLSLGGATMGARTPPVKPSRWRDSTLSGDPTPLPATGHRGGGTVWRQALVGKSRRVPWYDTTWKHTVRKACGGRSGGGDIS